MRTRKVLRQGPLPSTKQGRNSFLRSEKKVRGISESTYIPSTDQRTQNQIDPLQHLESCSRDLYPILFLRMSTEPINDLFLNNTQLIVVNSKKSRLRRNKELPACGGSSICGGWRGVSILIMGFNGFPFE